MYILLFFVLFLFINFIYNYRNYRKCDKHMKRFEKWLFEEDYERDLSLDKPNVKKLVKNAGFYGGLVPVTRPMGLGQVLNAQINPIDQYPDRTLDIAGAIRRQLANAKGVYWERMLFSINPFLWIEFILYLPSNIIKYLGF